MGYHNVNHFAEMELAGCMSIVVDYGNYICLSENLALRIALYRSGPTGQSLLEQIRKEAPSMPVHRHEYVINELQYEYRLARAMGKDISENESRLINEWVKRILLEYDIDDSLDFVNLLKTNRGTRTRS